MKRMWLVLGALLLFCCTSSSDVDLPDYPQNEQTPGEENPDTPDDSDTPETPDVPDTPDDPDSGVTPDEGEEVPSGDTGWVLTEDATLPEYDGRTAADASLDRVDAADEDYWENASFTQTVRIVYAGAAATVEAPAGALVTTDGAHVAVDLASAGLSGCELVVSGSSSDGSLKVYSNKKYKLTLEGVELTSSRGPAINNQSKKRLFLHLAAGTVNRLADASAYGDDCYYADASTASDEDRKGAFFSEGQVVVSGSGALRVTGRNKHAVATDEYFRMRCGATVVVEDAVKNGIHAKEGVLIDGGLLYVHVSGVAGKAVKTDGDIVVAGGQLGLYTSGGACYDSEESDTSSAAGLKSDGNTTLSGGVVALKSTGTGGKGINCDGVLTLSGATVEVVTTGGKYTYSQSLTSSPKGMKADGDVAITDGAINVRVVGRSDGSEGIESKARIAISGGRTTVKAYDDAINAATSISVSGGWVCGISESNDGIDSNGTLSVSGGVVIASGASQPEEGVDCDNNTFAITGGVVIATGGTTSSPTANACTQPSVICNGLSAQAGTVCSLLADGESLLGFTFQRTMTTCLLLSAPSLAQGKSYSIASGASPSGDTWNGYYESGSCTGGSQLVQFTLSSTVTTVGGGSQGGGPGGGGGRPW